MDPEVVAGRRRGEDRISRLQKRRAVWNHTKGDVPGWPHTARLSGPAIARRGDEESAVSGVLARAPGTNPPLKTKGGAPEKAKADPSAHRPTISHLYIRLPAGLSYGTKK